MWRREGPNESDRTKTTFCFFFVSEFLSFRFLLARVVPYSPVVLVFAVEGFACLQISQ